MPHPPVPGTVKCKEEQKEDEETPSFKESDDDKQKVEAPQENDEATMKYAHVTQDPEQALSAAIAAAQTGEGLPTGDEEHHQEADLQETSTTSKAPAATTPQQPTPRANSQHLRTATTPLRPMPQPQSK